MIINCKEIRDQEISKIKETYKGGCKVVFVQAGNNPSSDVYVRNKIKLCEEVGIEVKHIQRDENISQKDLIKLINEFNVDNNVHGIMVQLPLPDHINEETIIHLKNTVVLAGGVFNQSCKIVSASINIGIAKKDIKKAEYFALLHTNV